jgi:hypothetical protein
MNTNKAINYHLRNLMNWDQKYSYASMYLLYEEVIKEECFINEVTVMSESSWDRLLRAWSSVDGGWLVKEGLGTKAKFSKAQPECIFSKLHDKLKLWSKYVERIKT